MTIMTLMPDFALQFARALHAVEHAEIMAMAREAEARRIYLLPPPALRPGCPEGNICAEETFYTLAGFPISIFVPEVGCPVHDSED